MTARSGPRLASGALAFALFALCLSTNAYASAADRAQAERAFLRTVTPISANDVTGNLIRNIGRHVAFVCTVTAIVHADTMIGQCGRPQEPVDLYVLTPTAGLKIGTKMRVLGEMLTPAQWVDVTGHSWYTAMMKATFADRI